MTHEMVLEGHLENTCHVRHARWVTHGIEPSHVSSACQVHGVSGDQIEWS